MAGPSRSVPLQLVGVGVATVALLLAAYAFSGPRIYSIPFFFLTLASLAVMIGGIALAAWGRSHARAPAGAARGGARAHAAAAAARASSAPAKNAVAPRAATPPAPEAKRPEDVPPSKPLLRRLVPLARPKTPPAAPEIAADATPRARRKPARASGTQATGETIVHVRDVPDPPVERLHLRCPECAHQFDAEGRRPFEAPCPACGIVADVE